MSSRYTFHELYDYYRYHCGWSWWSATREAFCISKLHGWPDRRNF